jgi:hypothetical protein
MSVHAPASMHAAMPATVFYEAMRYAPLLLKPAPACSQARPSTQRSQRQVGGHAGRELMMPAARASLHLAITTRLVKYFVTKAKVGVPQIHCTIRLVAHCRCALRQLFPAGQCASTDEVQCASTDEEGLKIEFPAQAHGTAQQEESFLL